MVFWLVIYFFWYCLVGGRNVLDWVNHFQQVYDVTKRNMKKNDNNDVENESSPEEQYNTEPLTNQVALICSPINNSNAIQERSERLNTKKKVRRSNI